MAIKVYMSTQQGAPTMNGVAGTFITAMDAILVNGYGSVSVSTITRVSATATVTTSGAHGLETGDVALIGGAVEIDYNGEFVITVVNGTSFTYAVANAPATPATGTITSRRAPAGFAKPFAGTNKGVYRSIDIAGRRHFFHFIDDGTTAGGAREARLRGYEDMTDVDTGTDAYPTVAQLASGLFVHKSSTADSVAKHWVLISDGKTVYYFSYFSSLASSSLAEPVAAMSVTSFGDLIELKPGDIYCSMVSSGAAANTFSNVNSPLFSGRTSIAAGISGTSATFLARNFTAVPGAVLAGTYASGLLNDSFGGTAHLSYPHLVDNGFYMVPALLTQSTPSLIRARIPGFFEPMHGRCFLNTQRIENIQGFSGRKFIMMYGHHSSAAGSCVIDITGPWDS